MPFPADAPSRASRPYRELVRHERYDEIYISPHMDDAAYSCGGRILQSRAQGKKVLVVTVFGNGKAELETGATGTFSDYGKRLQEELAVMARLDADLIFLNDPELIFRKNSIATIARYTLPFLALSGPTHDQLFATLLEISETRLASTGQLFFPFAIGFHPDHRILFDVGRSLHALGRHRVTFYEDVPYSTVPALTALRLKFLGLPARVPLLSSASQINHFLFRSMGKVVYLSWLPILLYLMGLLLLRALLAGYDRLSGEPLPTRHVLPIADVIADKADVMRLYPSQTAFFLTLDETLVELIKIDGQSVEHSWTFPAFAGNVQRLSAAQAEAAQKLQRESTRRAP
jgi:hypothetical protein